MINITNQSNYEILKSEFRDGFEFKTMPLQYVMKNQSNTTLDNELLTDVFKSLFFNRKRMCETIEIDTDSLMQTVRKASFIKNLDINRPTKIVDTFNRGAKNPNICFMAWYDALAEYAISVASSLAGESAPLPTIQKTLDNLLKSLSNFEFRDAKKAVYENLKKIYPKTYKLRIKLCEQSYNKKVNEGVAQIVKQITHCV